MTPDAGLILVAGAPVILPEGRVPAGAWPELAYIMLAEPQAGDLPFWLARLEARLGVTDAHRQAMAARALAASEQRAAARRRLVDQSVRASQLSHPMRDPQLVEKIAKVQAKLAKAQAEADNPAGQSDRQKRKAVKVARQKMADLLLELAALNRKEADQDRLFGEAKDTILHAEARGGLVHTKCAQTAEFARDEHGARVLVKKRGKLPGQIYYEPQMVYSTGLRAKHLTGPEHALEAGLLAGGPRHALVLSEIANEYRGAYLIAEGEVSGGGEGGGGFGPKAPQPRQVEAGQDLADMRRRLSTIQRQVLDAVCGKDMRVREATTALGLGDYRTTARLLRHALAAARDSLHAARDARREAGEAGELGRRINRVNAMLSKVRL